MYKAKRSSFYILLTEIIFSLTGQKKLERVFELLQKSVKDFPQPDISGMETFKEAEELSKFLRSAKRPERPLKVVIAGAGKVVLVLAT